MTVYLAAPRNASVSCASPGCWCRDRVPRYPSDLTDQQWAVLEPRAREVMREPRTTPEAQIVFFCAAPTILRSVRSSDADAR